MPEIRTFDDSGSLAEEFERECAEWYVAMIRASGEQPVDAELIREKGDDGRMHHRVVLTARQMPAQRSVVAKEL